MLNLVELRDYLPFPKEEIILSYRFVISLYFFVDETIHIEGQLALLG